MKGPVIVIVVLAFAGLMAEPEQAITYGQVDASLAPCRAAYNYITQAATRYSNLKDDAAQPLPAKCGFPMDIPVSKSTKG
ncbi:hypothetical protein NMG60_11023136 [Bertholletia excelsa]